MKYGDTPHLFLHHELCPRSLLEQSLQKNVEAARFTKELLPLLVQGRIAPVEPDFKCEESCWIKSNALKHCKYPYFPVMFIGISFTPAVNCPDFFKTAAKKAKAEAAALASGKYDHTNQSTQWPPRPTMQSYLCASPNFAHPLWALSLVFILHDTNTNLVQMSQALWACQIHETTMRFQSKFRPQVLKWSQVPPFPHVLPFGAFGRSLGMNETPNSPSGIRSGEPNSTSRPRWSISYWCSWYLV